MHLKLLTTLTLFLIAAPLYSQVLWNIQIPVYGSGDSEGTAYAKAEQILRQKFVQHRSACQKQSGNFSSRSVRSFCDPYDPSTLFDPQTCMVLGYATCSSEPVVVEEEVAINEVGGNNNNAVDPGEKVEIAVTFTNSSKKPLKGLKFSLSVTGEQPILSLKQSAITVGNLNIGESKVVSFNGAILPSAPCGSRILLSFVANGASFQHSFTHPLSIGKLTEKPIVLEDTASMALNSKGVTFLLGEVTSPAKEISQMIFSYQATVRIPSQYRVWITTPSGQPIWAYFKDESRNEISFSRDLTEYLKKGSQTNGKWHFSGDMGNGNSAIIKGFKLILVPNSYSCQ